MDYAIGCDAKRIRRIEGCSGHEDCGKAHQRVKCGHELRHGCHCDAAREIGTDAAAQCNAADD
jgi:hypothetical protein